ncbi:hypothetical protein B0H19DRAFT_1154074 [Mycena capillaripes]|nr:hypothetical protein B0H19DRAFT_1154074 [Mycena capillaripes]
MLEGGDKFIVDPRGCLHLTISHFYYSPHSQSFETDGDTRCTTIFFSQHPFQVNFFFPQFFFFFRNRSLNVSFNSAPSSGIFQFDSSTGHNPAVPAANGSYQYPVMQMPYGTMNPMQQQPTAPPSAGSSLVFQQGIRAYLGGYPPQGYSPQGYPPQTSSLSTHPYAQAPVQQPGYYYNGNYSTHPGYNNGPGYYQGNGSYPSSSG